MVDRNNHTQVHCDQDNLAAQAVTVAEDAKAAFAATVAGSEIFLAICTLAEDEQAMSKPNVRRAVLDTLEKTQKWLQSHRQFQTDMQEAAQMLFSSAPSLS